MGTAGKTHFIRRTMKPEIRDYYFRQTQSDLKPDQQQTFHRDNTLFLRIDPNAALFTNKHPDIPLSWSGYELILSRIVLSQGYTDEKITDYYNRASVTGYARQLATYRFLEYATKLLATKYSLIVFIFDEFELLLDRMHPSYFINLRALRDEFRYQLVFVTMSRTEPILLRLSKESQQERKDLESFFELFRDVTYLTPAPAPASSTQVAQSDAFMLTRNLNARLRNTILKAPNYRFIWYLTGLHSGLVRTVLQKWDQITQPIIDVYNPHNLEPAVMVALEDQDIRHEVFILYESLLPEEQELLHQLSDHPATLSTAFKNITAYRSLRNKSILIEDNVRHLHIAPQLFRVYLKHGLHSQDNTEEPRVDIQATTVAPPSSLPEAPIPLPDSSQR